MNETILKRFSLIVQGQVQGVGFRPFIWRLAKECALTGRTLNTSAGVLIEIQGNQESLIRFENILIKSPPPLAKITAIHKKSISPIIDEVDFTIIPSQGHAGQNVLVSPDVSICNQCLEDIRNPLNPRFAYPFTNCVNCGPRYTITKKIPYDRNNTVMDCFSLCEYCSNEYSNPADRRFHAQPIACPACGPQLWFINKKDAITGHTSLSNENTHNAISQAIDIIRSGGILALKGLGGFQLVCDATKDEAVQTLRIRKHRPSKSLAVMIGDIEGIEKFCSLTYQHKELLCGNEKPIVLCPINKENKNPLSSLIAPDCSQIGIMLPYTPLHALLFDRLKASGIELPILVMTSANPKGEPICLGNREAIARLSSLADGWLLHNRDILCRVDDSVVGITPNLNLLKTASNTTIFLRRARGYAPAPLNLIDNGVQDTVFGAGAELKSTFCLTRNNQAFPSPHIGDLDNPSVLNFYEQTLEHMLSLLECKPSLIVHDLHPNFISSHSAQKMAEQEGLDIISLQHHAAHAAAVLAENNCYEPSLVLCLDGTGLGTDKTIWGGEVIYMDLLNTQWERLGSMKPFALVGGDAAIKQPWRIASALQWHSGKLNPRSQAEKAIAEMMERNINCPLTSSCGRLFDSISAMLGLCREISYEGQAAILLEKAAWEWIEKHKETAPPNIPEINIIEANNLKLIDSISLFNTFLERFLKTGDIPLIAATFHFSLAEGFAKLCTIIANKFNISTIGLSGGVMQNSIFLSLLRHKLEKMNFKVLIQEKLPSGDGGISFGQAVFGRQILFNKKVKQRL